MIRDPVCLTKSMAVLDGHRYYFYSQGCREQFISDPERYHHNAQA